MVGEDGIDDDDEEDDGAAESGEDHILLVSFALCSVDLVLLRFLTSRAGARSRTCEDATEGERTRWRPGCFSKMIENPIFTNKKL